jgi:hypothetical protein
MRALARSTGLDQHNDISTTITSGGIAQVLQAQFQDRHYLFVQNPSTASGSVYIDWGKPAVMGYPSVELAPGDNCTEEGNFVSGEVIYVIASDTGHQIVARTNLGVP